MPTKTFLNLDKSKQNKILDAAIYEFSNNEYNDVSINKIITNSNIPRGSFYMYFNDKDDLFSYIIQLKSEKFNNIVKTSFLKNNGDFFNSFVNLYDIMEEKIISNDFKFLFKNTFIYLHIKKEKEHIKPLFLLYDSIKTDIITINIKQELIQDAFILSMQVLFSILVEYIKTKNLELKNTYIKRIKIICYGIYKEEINDKNI